MKVSRVKPTSGKEGRNEGEKGEKKEGRKVGRNEGGEE